MMAPNSSKVGERTMKILNIMKMLLLGSSALLLPEIVYANAWSNYSGVKTTKNPPRPPQVQQSQNPPTRFNTLPRVHQNPPKLSSSFNHQPSYDSPKVHPSQRPHPHPQQSGLSIEYHHPQVSVQYHVPAQQVYQYSYQSQPLYQGSGQIQHSTHTMISDWRGIGLPAPPSGMYWAFEHGRYVLIQNR